MHFVLFVCFLTLHSLLVGVILINGGHGGSGSGAAVLGILAEGHHSLDAVPK